MALTILVADDEPALASTLTRFFERKGHAVRSAGSAATALALMEEVEFDLALVDANMPGNGRSVLEALEDHPDFSGHAVLMTGDAPDEDERLPGNAGLLAKPFEFEELFRLLEETADGTS